MSADNILQDIWQSYRATVDCFKIAGRSIARNEYRLFINTEFQYKLSGEVEDAIRKSRSAADDYVILALWAVFERQLFEYLQRISKRISETNGSDFTRELQSKIEDEMEYWKANDILDLFKVVLNPELIGRAKQVKKYRDWVAHQNPKKGQPTNVPPKSAFKILSNVIEQIETHAEFQNDTDTA